MSYEIRKPLTLEQIMAHDGKLPEPKSPLCNYCQHPEDYPIGEVSRHIHTRGPWLPVTPGGQTQVFTYTEVAFTRDKIKVLVQTLDEYEATIVLAYIKRLIKTREGQTTNG